MVWEIKRYVDYLKKSFFQRQRLNFLILYVTSKCNLACGGCFFHKSLNRTDDLTLKEYEKISWSAGRFSLLGLGGGEPFLRSELADICALFVKQNKVDSIFIPTNGVLTKSILAQTEHLLKQLPGVSISVNPSLDGLADYHDKNRGRSGVFAACLKTIQGLTELKRKYAKLQVIVNSVVRRDNLAELIKLMEYLKQFNIDFQAFELLRGQWRDSDLSLPALHDIKMIHGLILKNRLWHLNRRKRATKFNLIYKLEKLAVLGILKYSQQFKEAFLAGSGWPCPCPAGKTIQVIYPDGAWSVCELILPALNLRQYNYNLEEAARAYRLSNDFPARNCACTHICFIHAAMAAYPKSIFGITIGYFKAKKVLKYD